MKNNHEEIDLSLFGAPTGPRFLEVPTGPRFDFEPPGRDYADDDEVGVGCFAAESAGGVEWSGAAYTELAGAGGAGSLESVVDLRETIPTPYGGRLEDLDRILVVW